jgi:hypothetical protein
VPALNSGFAQVCGLKWDGAIICWGANWDGQAPVVSLAPDALPDARLDAAYG